MQHLTFAVADSV